MWLDRTRNDASCFLLGLHLHLHFYLRWNCSGRGYCRSDCAIGSVVGVGDAAVCNADDSVRWKLSVWPALRLRLRLRLRLDLLWHEVGERENDRFSAIDCHSVSGCFSLLFSLCHLNSSLFFPISLTRRY